MAMDCQNTKNQRPSIDVPDQCTLDHQSLKQAFFRGFDPSLVRQFCAKLALTQRDWQQTSVGGGSHFHCFKLPRPGVQMDLAIKLPTPAFGPQKMKNLQKALRRLKTSPTASLLAPMEVVDFGEGLTLVMPFADQVAKQAKAHWQPLSIWVSHLNAYLDAQGLEIDDLIQIRCWQGIPFLIDVSDLRIKEGGGRS